MTRSIVILANDPGTANYENHRNRRVSKDEFIKLLRKKHPGIRCLRYEANHAKATFQCEGHKTQWTTSPYQLLGNKHGCPECAKQYRRSNKKTHYSFVQELKKVNPDLKVVGRYEGSGVPIRVRCLSCSHVWHPRPGNLLHNKSGCPECYKSNPPSFSPGKSKVIQVGSRQVRVQGYEGRVIEKLLAKGTPPERIEVFSEGKIPTIPYKMKGVQHNYWPDLRVGQTLVEVKSPWTLFKFWKVNVAKARACFKEGRKLKVVVGSETDLVVLPEDWFKRKQKEVEALLARKFVKSLRILAFDPGVTNFAWVYLEVTRPFKVSVVESGMIHTTIKTLDDDILVNATDFLGEVSALFKKFKPQQFIMERFMARGMKGLTIELVNIMIGIHLGWLTERKFSFERRVKLITAAQWKNEWNKNASLEDFYKKPDVVPHQVDALGIGLYGAYYWFRDQPFANIAALEASLVSQLNETNQGHLIRRRGL